MKNNDVTPSCCEIIGLTLYMVFRVFIIICPIVAQIRVIYILCNKQEYLGSPDKCTRIVSHIELAIGLYIIVYLILAIFINLIKFVTKNFNNQQEPCKMHLAQTIAGLIVFKVYYQLFVMGFKLFEDNSNILKLLGTLILTILTAGIFLIFVYFTVTCKYWDSQHDCQRETVRFIAGLGIIYIYYQLWKYGLKWTYQNKEIGYLFLGIVFLTVATAGLFIPVYIIQILAYHWYSENDCYRETVRFIGGLGIFYIYYLIWKYGIKWFYAVQDIIYAIIGFVFLTVATVGLFIPFAFLQFLYNNFNSQNQVKRETVRFIVGLGIFYIQYKMISYGYKFIYEQNQDSTCFTVFSGYILLSLATGLLYLIYKPFELTYTNWNSENLCKREFARCAGTLIIPYFYYQIVSYSMKWVYDQTQNYCLRIFGFILLSIFSLGIFIPIALFQNGLYNVYRQQNTCLQLLGHIQLTIATLGLFIPVRLIEFSFNSWNSGLLWKRQLSRFIVGLGVFYIWIRLFQISFQYSYDKQTFCQNFIGKLGLTITTFGLYIIVMIIQYINFTYNCLNNHHFLSENYVKGVILASIPTFGFYGLFFLIRLENRLLRYLGNFGLTAINAVGAYYSIYYINATYKLENYQFILIIVGFSVISYTFYWFMRQFVVYNSIIRYMFNMIMRGFILFFRGIGYSLALIYYPIYLLLNSIGNTFKRMGCWIQTKASSFSAYFANQRWTWQGYFFRIQTITEEQPGYQAPIIYQPNIVEAQTFKTWDQRQEQRKKSPSYKLNEAHETFIFILKCISARAEHMFNHTLHRFSLADVVLWVERYAQISKEDQKIKQYYEKTFKSDQINLNDPQNFKLVENLIKTLQRQIQTVKQKDSIQYFTNIKNNVLIVQGSCEV